MKKSSAIFVSVGLALAGLGIWYWQQQHDEISIQNGSISLATLEVGHPQSDSLLHSLHSRMVAALSVYPGNLSAVVDYLAALKARLAEGALWKQFKIDQALEKLDLEKVLGEQTSSNLSEKQLSGLKTLLLIQDTFKTLQEVSVAASQDSFELDPQLGARFPTVLLSARFSQGTILDLIRTTLQKAAEDNTPANGFQLASIEPSGSRYEYSSKERPSIGGIIALSEKGLSITVGTSNEKDFFTHNSTDSLGNSALWKSSARAFPPQPFFVGLVDYHRALPIFDELFKHATQQAQSPISLASMIDFDTLGIGASVADGFEFRQCVTLKDKSRTQASYQTYLTGLLDPATQFSQFERLVTQRTIMAIRVPRRLLLYLIHEYGETLAKNHFGSPAPDVSWQEFSKRLKQLEPVLQQLPFEEIGFIVNAYASLTPEIGLFLGGPTRVDLVTLARSLNDAIAVIGSGLSPEALPEARLVKIPGATSGPLVEKLEITAGGQAITFLPVSDNAVLASSSPSLLQAATQAMGLPPSFLPSLSVKNKSILKNLASSDYYFVLNIDTLVEMAKPFIPLLLLQFPEAKISAPQVEEVLKQLSFGLVGVQNTLRADSEGASRDSALLDTVCGQLSLQVF